MCGTAVWPENRTSCELPPERPGDQREDADRGAAEDEPGRHPRPRELGDTGSVAPNGGHHQSRGDADAEADHEVQDPLVA